MIAIKPCIFCRIIEKELSSKIVLENDDVMVIEDIAPKAPVHYLIIPKKHLKDLVSLGEGDGNLLAGVAQAAKECAKKLSGSQSFQLVTNNGRDAGQSVLHLHFHFLSGKKILDL